MTVLGNKYRDKVSGFTGTCTAKTEYLFTTCTSGITPEGLKDGQPIPTQWFEDGRLEPIESEKKVEGFA